MKVFHHSHWGSLRSAFRLHALHGVAVVTLFSLSLGLGSVALADSGAPDESPTSTELTAVSGPSDRSSEVRRSSFTASADAYVGMTRSLEREKIESIDPTDWLTRFGTVKRD